MRDIRYIYTAYNKMVYEYQIVYMYKYCEKEHYHQKRERNLFWFVVFIPYFFDDGVVM